MLAVAAQRGTHQRLIEADVTATGLEADQYDLVIASLVDEHLSDLRPLYREAARLAVPGGTFIIVAFHPHFIMHSGMPTHFTNDAGEHIAITTHVHLISDHVAAALESGWALSEMREGLINDRWLAVKPEWERFRDHPISMAFAWRAYA